jgi:hypothetical protein
MLAVVMLHRVKLSKIKTTLFQAVNNNIGDSLESQTIVL